MGCLKRKRGRSYVTVKLARSEARERYDESGTEIYVYRCYIDPCGGRALHLTSRPPETARDQWLNKPLLNHYAAEKIRGTSDGRAAAAYQRRKKVRRQLPHLTWDDEGGGSPATWLATGQLNWSEE